ncbi:MAG TPA: hypothetical protein VN706_04735 [Gemmatimonadaceae bacterium]|nr:hypothetical protein [Gemmatimonadaceae bacterium]
MLRSARRSAASAFFRRVTSTNAPMAPRGVPSGSRSAIAFP